MGHEGRCNVHLGGLDGGVGRKLAVSEVRMGERHLCHAIGWSWPAALRPPPSNNLLVTSCEASEPTIGVVTTMRGGGWDFGAVGGNEVELSSVLDLFYFIHYTQQCPQAFSDRQLRFTIEHSRKVSLVKLWYKFNAKCTVF